VEQQAEAQKNVDDTQPLKSEYLDVIVSDVRPSHGFTFSVQVLNTEGISSKFWIQ